MTIKSRLDKLARPEPEPGSIEVWLTKDGETYTHGDEVLSAQELENRQSGPEVLVVNLVRRPGTGGTR